ncbi:MAG TPA: TetR family transcriptional regulator [Solirubrobacteraceae bacterium]|nr:TetR family transcriptional regulator [Solirubrobacteraceae bacterium]
MSVEDRELRADARRNRQRLLEAAQTLFRERGLEVGVAEIAEAAGVGRGTLFRNFASKEDLIEAVVAKRMYDAAAYGEQLLHAEDPGEALFDFMAQMVGRQQLDRALFEAIDETWLSKEVIRPAHAAVFGILEQLTTRAQAAGAIRDDVSAVDVMMMFKGACLAATTYGREEPGAIERYLDLIRASFRPVAGGPPLRGRSPTLGDLGGGRSD